MKPITVTYADLFGTFQIADFDTIQEANAFIAGRKSAGVGIIPQPELPLCPDCQLPIAWWPEADCEKPELHMAPQPKV